MCFVLQQQTKLVLVPILQAVLRALQLAHLMNQRMLQGLLQVPKSL
jgi:hypothetical protein